MIINKKININSVTDSNTFDEKIVADNINSKSSSGSIETDFVVESISRNERLLATGFADTITLSDFLGGRELTDIVLLHMSCIAGKTPVEFSVGIDPGSGVVALSKGSSFSMDNMSELAYDVVLSGFSLGDLHPDGAILNIVIGYRS